MTVQEAVREHLRAAIRDCYQIDLPELGVEVPPRTELGDLAFPVAFELGKRLKLSTGQKHNPRDIATRLAQSLQEISGVERVEIAGAGYLNVFLDRAEYLATAMKHATPSPQFEGKVIVEHTSVNPNKAMHIGHLRNAVLGDTTVRLLRAAGETVEVQNYIDNTGVQVADVVVGFKYLEKKMLDEITSIDDRFDYYCWDLYARVGAFYEEDPFNLELRTRTLHEIEQGTGETYEMSDYVSTRILKCHLATMQRLDIEYDVLPRESDVLHLDIWQRAFALLKERGAIEYATEGRLKGCWVMRAEDQRDADGDTEHEADKVIVRSNGIVTYTGKDIAFHLWKLGQLGVDFYYKPFYVYPDDRVVWVTTSNPDENDEAHAPFGNGAAYFNVIDIGQSYPQHYVKLGVMAADRDDRVARSAHLAYEKVVLSASAAEELGQRVSEEDRKRGSVAMSGRKGLGVKVDDLIDQLQLGALREVTARHSDMDDAQQRETARRIAIAALRYFLLKYTRTSIISFDFKEALALKGETGPYIQYSVTRVNSIFRKLLAAGVQPDAVMSASGGAVKKERLRELLTGDEGDDLWSLIYLATRLPDTVRGAVSSLEPAILAKWTFQLAQKFSLFYDNDRYHILSETDPDRRALLITITAIVRQQLLAALEILGIEAPERM